MKHLSYLSQRTGRVFSKYEKAYEDAIGFRFTVLDEPYTVAKNKAIKNVKIVFLWLDEK